MPGVCQHQGSKPGGAERLAWAAQRASGREHPQRQHASDKVETEIRYFLSSYPDDPVASGQAVRAHWAVENALHWVLDVTFREDDSRVHDRTATRNLALLRKIAINLVGRDQTTKSSVRAKRKKAVWNDAYMLQLLVR